MEEQSELLQQFRIQQEKYVYYLIALSVAAIGFSVSRTSGLPLQWLQWPLGVAVLSWGASIFCGFRFLSYAISALYNNNIYLDIIKGKYPGIGPHPEYISAASKGVMEAMEENGKIASRFFKWHGRLFYIGVIFFLAWHVLEMYSKVGTN